MIMVKGSFKNVSVILENNCIMALLHIQTSIAFDRPADAAVWLFWNTKDKSGDN